MFIQHQHEWSAFLHHDEASIIVDTEGRRCRQLVFSDSALCFVVMRVVASPTIFFVLGKNSQAQLDTLTLIGPNFGPHCQRRDTIGRWSWQTAAERTEKEGHPTAPAGQST